MKYVIEITGEKIIKTFIDDEGKEYSETWVVKGRGITGTDGPCITSQLENEDEYEDELLEAIDSDYIDDIWDYIRKR